MNELETLAYRFRRFAELECRDSSQLYERLSTCVAGDAELLEMATHCSAGQPAPNLFFGAAHLVLLENPGHPLSAYYASVEETPKEREGAYPHFRALCLEHSERIVETVSTRRVQTNEVGRCAVLLPAFAIVAERSASREAAFIEVGASAGLNLLWDRFRYEYGGGARWGDPSSPVRLVCEPIGAPLPPIPDALPSVVLRVGIDLDPVDLGDAESVRWLRALIWPEHRRRVAALAGALRLAASDPPVLVAADALDALPGVLETVPPDAATCVFHTHTLNQFPPDARRRFGEILDEFGARSVRRVHRAAGRAGGARGRPARADVLRGRTQDLPRAGPVRQPRHVAGMVRRRGLTCRAARNVALTASASSRPGAVACFPASAGSRRREAARRPSRGSRRALSAAPRSSSRPTGG